MGTASYSMKNPYKVQRSLNGSNIKLMWLIKRPIGDFGFETLGTVKSDNWLFWEPFSPLIWPWLNICIEMALVSAYHTWSWSDWECVRWLQLHSGSLTASGLPVFCFFFPASTNSWLEGFGSPVIVVLDHCWALPFFLAMPKQPLL